MTLNQYSRYCWAQSLQAHYMDMAVKTFESGAEQDMWVSLIRWAHYKHIADEINCNNDSMAFARAIGMAHGIEKAFK